MASSALNKHLKDIILEVAAENEKIGPLEESLKWGEPSFTPVKKNVGSSVRLADRDDGTVGMYFVCTTKLVDRFQEVYPDAFDYRDGRAIIFEAGRDFDVDALKHCIGMTLTNKLKR